jgi:putative oxidoreductase
MKIQAIDGGTATVAMPRRMSVALSDIFRTSDDLSPAILRGMLAVVLFPHGAQHLLGWFGGYGFAGTYQWMTGLGFPGVLAAVAIITEFVAPLALVFGIGSRAAALGIVGLMAGAVTVHLANGFFMNWFGALPAGAEGYEYHLLLATIAVAVAIAGAGRWSLDRLIAQRLAGAPTAHG